jgi:hypothetical protein
MRVRSRKGFALTLFLLTFPLWFFILAAIGTLVEFGAMVYDLSPKCLNGFCSSGDGGSF